MTDLRPAAEDSGASEPATTASDEALGRYRTRLRRQRLVYFAVVGAVVAALIVTVVVAWSRGEAGNTTLHTVSSPPATLALADPSAAPQLVWRTGDRAALGTPRYEGTVVVWGRHTVRGIDARTGRQTWSYTRSNRVVCSALQASGTTVAVFAVKGNCDEVTGLASDTGVRRWTRTLDQNGQPVNGQPGFQVVPYTVLVTTPDVVYAVDPTSGLNRWTYARYGCTITHAVLGSTGALISQTCTDVQCGQLKFCGNGPQLLLRDPNAATDDQSKNPTNFDHILWQRTGSTDVPVSADGVVSALNTATRTLDLLSGTDGRTTGTVTLSPTPAASGPITAVSVGTSELVTVRGVGALLDGGSGRATWSQAVTGPITAVPPTDTADLGLDDARITAATTTGAAVLDDSTGRVAREVTLTPAPASGASVYPLGSGQLVTASSGTAAYA